MTKLTLRASIFAFAGACLLAVVTVFSGFVYLRGDHFTDSTLDYTVRFRTKAVATTLARSLEQDWRGLVYLSGQVASLSPQALSNRMTGAAGDGSRISWLGYADLSGTVIAATNDLLLGQDVSGRPWYRNGLSGGYAADVHDAVLLAKLLGNGKDPLRFISLARPVTDAKGETVGVLGMNINAVWLDKYLADSSKQFDLDFYLIDPDGKVSASSTHETLNTADLQILRAAQTGIGTHNRETWPDGRDYFSSLVPQIAYGDLPNFGWRMVGRLNVHSINFGFDLMKNGAQYAALTALALVALLTALFAGIVAKPFSELATSAQRLSEGSQEYPPISRVTREAAQLSAALIRLQQDRISDDV